ncbi:MAG: NUDIX pyrophosphatase [Ignavibacteria bacterium]|nr:NUDIX pyrophosphatase [Ignavibacteria bacterium]
MPEINSIYIECYVIRRVRNKLKFLIIKRSGNDTIYPGIWQIVTGKIEPEEKAYEAALREIEEETGLKPGRLFVIPHTTTFYSPERDAVSLVPLFFCETSEKNVLLSKEHTDFKWLDAEKASEKLFFKSQKENVNFIDSNFRSKDIFKTFKEIKF